MPGRESFTVAQRRQTEDLLKRLRPEVDKAIRRILADPKMKDERVPKDLSVTRAKITTNAVGGVELAGHNTDDDRRAVAIEHCKDSLRGGATDAYKLRRLEGSGVSGAAASSDHAHSNTAFVHYPKEERLRMIADLEALEALDPAGLDPVSRIFRANLLNSLRLQMGYRKLGPRERERALERGGWWATLYKRVFGVDEYCDDDGLPRLNERSVRGPRHEESEEG